MIGSDSTTAHGKTSLYTNDLGTALIGLSPAILFAANHPESSRDTIS